TSLPPSLSLSLCTCKGQGCSGSLSLSFSLSVRVKCRGVQVLSLSLFPCLPCTLSHSFCHPSLPCFPFFSLSCTPLPPPSLSLLFLARSVSNSWISLISE